jgi:hypothetical protein
MASDSSSKTALEMIVAGLPEMAKYLASIPHAQQADALAALKAHYLKTAVDMGYSEEPARMWVAALIAQLEQMNEQIWPSAGAAPKKTFTFADKLLTRIIAAVVVVVASPLIAFIWIGLKLERPGPVVTLRKAEHGPSEVYSFVLGPGRVSQFVRYADLQSLPSLWHLLNGDAVFRLKDLAQIVWFPSSKPPRK